jgi:hypothetical protein
MWELCYAPPNICIDRIRWEVISRWTFVYGYFVKKSQPALHLWCNNLKKGKYTVKILPVPFSLTDHEFIWTWPLISFCQMLAYNSRFNQIVHFNQVCKHRSMVYSVNAIFNNISVISWRSFLLVEKKRPVASHWQTLSHNVVSPDWVSNSQRKSRDRWACSPVNVFKWNNLSTCRLLFQWASMIKIQLIALVIRDHHLLKK